MTLLLEVIDATVQVRIYMLESFIVNSSAGTTGEDCHENPDDCVVGGQNVCNDVDQNATCIDGLESYTCVCDNEYTGSNCEESKFLLKSSLTKFDVFSKKFLYTKPLLVSAEWNEYSGPLH